MIPGDTHVIWNSLYGEFKRIFGRKRLNPFIQGLAGTSWIVVKNGARALYSEGLETEEATIIGVLMGFGGGLSYAPADRWSFSLSIRPQITICGTVKAFESEVQSASGIWGYCLVVETGISYIFKAD